MNKVILMGNLTRDPEVKHTQSGKAWVRVGIAVNRPFAKDSVDFFNLVAWDKTAEFLGKYFVKGQKALIEGRLQTSTYKNKDGVEVNSVDVIVENVEFASSKCGSDKQETRNTQHTDRLPSAEEFDTPF